MLIATAITLVMMAAVATVFDQFGRTVNDSRATLEMSARIRDARIRLQRDLDGLTTPPIPLLRPDAGAGYLEILEGSRSDLFPTRLALSTASLLPSNDSGNLNSAVGPTGLGDADDILMMTVRSTGAPFLGRALRLESDGVTKTPIIVQSQVAEIVWFAVENPAGGPGEPGMRSLYRRILLVMPGTHEGFLNAANVPAPMSELEFYRNFDVSARLPRHQNSQYNKWELNTLADLTKRENRFAHDPENFPHPVNAMPIRGGPNGQPDFSLSGTLRPFGSITDSNTGATWAGERFGEDLVMSNVLAFDVRVFDPDAPIFRVDQTAVAPGDPAYRGSILIGRGAFVDLGYDPTATILGQSAQIQGLIPYAYPAVPQINYRLYDTWPLHYEHDGIDQDGNGVADQGSDGFDSNGNGIVDDILERETHPPYDVPLKGIEIRIRAYEPFSRQVKELSVVRGF
jgi:hypothetical protein